MPRILITADREGNPDGPVLLDERVLSIHLSDGHAAEQLIERLGWAISDAEEPAPKRRRSSTERRKSCLER